jgi:asparagine synthase (glutamine-hydrolysing)
MKPGLYALASFDGAPLAREDLKALGIAVVSAENKYSAPGIVVCAVDDSPAQDAVSVAQKPESIAVFLGYLDEQQELRAKLSMPDESAPAELVWAAIERLGRDAPAALLGEWSFLRWDLRARELTLLGSEAFRDSLYYSTGSAAGGGRFALAPDLLALTRLSWVGRSLDPEGFALRMSQAGLRRITGRRTVWRGISSALPAVREVFSLGQHTEVTAPAHSEPERWRGSFEEAVEALNAVGQRIVGQNMRRYGRSAFLLSGGLDSTLLTTLGAQARGDGAEMFCLSSVAPDGLGIADESEFSAAVAAGLGVARECLVPAPEVSIYMPSPGAFEAYGEPIAGPRQYLYDAFFRAAGAAGANAVFDGQLARLVQFAGLASATGSAGRSGELEA